MQNASRPEAQRLLRLAGSVFAWTENRAAARRRSTASSGEVLPQPVDLLHEKLTVPPDHGGIQSLQAYPSLFLYRPLSVYGFSVKSKERERVLYGGSIAGKKERPIRRLLSSAFYLTEAIASPVGAFLCHAVSGLAQVAFHGGA